MSDQYDDIDDFDDDFEDTDAVAEPADDLQAARARTRQRSKIPANAPRPQDRKPKKRKPAPRREAEGDEMVVIEFGGREYEVPADQDDWPILAVQAFSRQQHIDAIEHLLGPRQWAQFIVRHPKKRDFEAFSERIADEFGFGGAGN
ncbi:hypothetical protein G4X40_18540 [Rhodococcus sp. D2-41]|uniref:hypothetical protein n=1 Tax=Speluncibacter jeojiensis TaxID=2710754 RepID=UPI00240EFB34|nr:hypothetical protein [Rhodococcus sp. D2-41]MDG3012144.1 hypothetical protein [Rhodococcus sp. D2-41]